MSKLYILFGIPRVSCFFVLYLTLFNLLYLFIFSLDNKKKNKDIFGCEYETIPSSKDTTSPAGSTFQSRVANGISRRVASVHGEFYIDLKVYNTTDFIKYPFDERWKKALLTLKLQSDQGSTQWSLLQKFVKGCHDVFKDSNAVFYADKINP